MASVSHPNLRKALKLVGKHRKLGDLPPAFRLVVWELMKSITRIATLEKKMAHKKKAHQVKMKAPCGPMAKVDLHAKKMADKKKDAKKKG